MRASSITLTQVEKLFDVACTLTDVMSCVPLEPSSFTFGPRDYLTQFLDLISALRGGDSRYLPLLLAKIDDALPAMTAPIADSLPFLPANEQTHDFYESPTSSNSTPYGSPSAPSTTGLDYPGLTTSMSHIHIASGASYPGTSTMATSLSFYQTIDATGYPR